MKFVGVITGDIISSAKVVEREVLLSILKEALSGIDNILGTSDSFEIFRGDSFQAIIQEPDKALLAAVLVRTRLRQWKKNGTGKAISITRLPDARIGIGIGGLTFRSDKIIESDGEAFQYSGRLLDEMKSSGKQLSVKTPWEEVNEELKVTAALMDAIIGRWSSQNAEAVYLLLSQRTTQKELAEKIGISQPAVSKRLVHSNIEAVQGALKRFESLINMNK